MSTMTTESVEEIIWNGMEAAAQSDYDVRTPTEHELDVFTKGALTALTTSGYAIEQGWKPIDSAPKDGTRVILDWGGSAVTGYYLDNSHTQWPWQGWKVPSLERFPLGQPTRWRPFPSVGDDA